MGAGLSDRGPPLDGRHTAYPRGRSGIGPTLESALAFYHEDDRPVIGAAIERATETGEPFDATLRLVTADGQQRWVTVSGKAIRDSGETIQDVTQQSRSGL